MGRMTTYVSDLMGTRTDNSRNDISIGHAGRKRGYTWGMRTAALALVVCLSTFLVSAQTTDSQDLDVIEDGYIQGSTGYNNEMLYLQSASPIRKSYLLFDVSGISGTITALELILTVHVDEGTSGTVEVHQSNDDAWVDDNLNNTTRPSEDVYLGALSAPFTDGAVKTLSIPLTTITANDRVSLALVRTGTSTDDMAFASSGPDAPYFDYAPNTAWPKLRVTFTTGSSNVAVTGVSVNPTSLNLDIGTTGQLTESIAPGNATNQTVTWASSDTAVATVNSTGLVTAVAAGSATVTVTTQDGGMTAQAMVNVTDPNAPPTSGGHWTQTGSDLSYTAGDVGIGTAPHNGYMLSVAGNIISENVRVELQTNWPDYVFGDDYTLPTLDEVAQYIETNGHLINVPSAATIQAEGIDLGEMNKLLLEKIEELTLYILEQEEALQQLETTIQALEHD